MSEYELGQIIYIVSDKASGLAIVPAIISEEFVHKKLNGNTITYKVAIGEPGKQKILSLDQIDGTVYLDLNKLKEEFITKVTTFIDNSVAEAEKRVEDWYRKENKHVNSSDSSKIDPQTFLNSPNKPLKLSPNSPKENLKDKLRNIVDPGEDFDMEPVTEEIGLRLEDGREVKAKVNFNG